MHNLILHIGMPKTGSTSIQFSLFNLNTERFFYPNLGGVCHNLSLCSLFSKNPQDIHLNRDRTLEEINKYIKNVRHKLRKILQTENKIIILSGEGIPILSKNEIFKMKKFFNKFGRMYKNLEYLQEFSNQ